jgi:uncharacterized membrane protein
MKIIDLGFVLDSKCKLWTFALFIDIHFLLYKHNTKWMLSWRFLTLFLLDQTLKVLKLHNILKINSYNNEASDQSPWCEHIAMEPHNRHMSKMKNLICSHCVALDPKGLAPLMKAKPHKVS